MIVAFFADGPHGLGQQERYVLIGRCNPPLSHRPMRRRSFAGLSGAAPRRSL